MTITGREVPIGFYTGPIMQKKNHNNKNCSSQQ